MDFGLQGKLVLVTGAARGLGRAVAAAFAAEGASLLLNYRTDPARADAFADSLATTYGVTARACRADVADEGEVEAMFDTAVQLGGLDILVNNAGICPVSPFMAMERSEWDAVIRTNLTGAFLCCRAAARYFAASGRGGRIVNVTSQSAYNGSATGKSHYAASKGGLTALTISLARELAPFGITVNAVAPGMMHTDMTAAGLGVNRESYEKSIPLGRLGRPDETAAAVVYLASHQAAYITGATLHVSGGMCMR